MRRQLVTAILLLGTTQPVGAQASDSTNARTGATRFLAQLVGRWEGRSVVGPDGRQRVVSVRVYVPAADSLSLAWRDSVVDGPSGHGTLSFNPILRQFYYAGTYAPSHAPLLLRGRLDASGTRLPLQPFPAAPGTELNSDLVASVLRVPSSAAHTWSRWDDAWIISFRRLP